MGALHPIRKWALDTNFLLQLAEGKSIAQRAWEAALDNGISLVATRVVIRELHFISRDPYSPRLQVTAARALADIRKKWLIEPLGLSSIEFSIAAAFANACLEHRIIPTTERNDALVLGEAAIKAIPFVITSDRHLLEINHQDLSLLCQTHDVSIVSVLHPITAQKALIKK
jgi:rRNA-processing protein FCF1